MREGVGGDRSAVITSRVASAETEQGQHFTVCVHSSLCTVRVCIGVCIDVCLHVCYLSIVGIIAGGGPLGGGGKPGGGTVMGNPMREEQSQIKYTQRPAEEEKNDDGDGDVGDGA